MLNKTAVKALKAKLLKIEQQVKDAYEQYGDLLQKERALKTVIEMATTKGSGKRASLVDSRTSPLREAMTEIFSKEEAPIKANAVRKKLQEKKIHFTTGHFWRILKRMEERGTIKRMGVGMYQFQKN